MEFEVLDEKVEWEARRVGVAFGVEKWERNPLSDDLCLWGKGRDSVGVEYTPARHNSRASIHLGDGDVEHCCWTNCLHLYPGNAHYNKLMARGLYCLGIENEGVNAQLNSPLTAHEKLELRLSMPREFWPKTWLDEEDTITKPLDSQ